MGTIEDSWRELDAGADALNDTAKRLGALTKKATTASRGGSPSQCIKALTAVRDELATLTAIADRTITALGNTTAQLERRGALVREVEADLRAALGDSRRVWRQAGQVVAYPVVVHVHLKGDKVSIDGKLHNTQRPAAIVAAVTDALRVDRPHEKLARALHDAFRLTANGRETGEASLDHLRQILGTTRPGGDRYSPDDFRTDLQWLYASPLRTLSGGIEFGFRVASAGATAFSAFDRNGELINLGYIVFSRPGALNG